jgi:hypothetical protein
MVFHPTLPQDIGDRLVECPLPAKEFDRGLGHLQARSAAPPRRSQAPERSSSSSMRTLVSSVIASISSRETATLIAQ